MSLRDSNGKTGDVTLVHIMTVPQSLFFLTGQVRYMKDVIPAAVNDEVK